MFNLKGEDGSNILIDSVMDKPLKFLGSIKTGSNIPSDIFTQIIPKQDSKLTNIDVREAFKKKNH